MKKVTNFSVAANLPTSAKRAIVRDAFKGGAMATVTWIKKGGDIVTVNGRTGVTKYLKKSAKPGKNGSTNTVAHLPQYLTVMKNKTPKGAGPSYKNVNCDTVLCLKYDGNVLHFTG